jgi:FG-GAP repeat protein
MITEKSVSFLKFCLKLTIGLFFLSLYACNSDDINPIDNASIKKPISGHQSSTVTGNKTRTFNYAGTAYSKTSTFGLNTVPHKNMSLNNQYMFAMTRFGPDISDKQINLFYGLPSAGSFFPRENKPFSTHVFDVKSSTVAPISISGLVINIFDKAESIGLTAINPSNDRLIHIRQNNDIHQATFEVDNNNFLSTFKRASNFKLPDSEVVKKRSADQIIATSNVMPVTNNTDNVEKDVVLDVAVSSVDIKTIRFDWSAVRGATQYKLFVNPDGISGFNLLQDMQSETHTTVKLPLHLTDWINTSYIMQAYDDVGIVATSSVIDITSIMKPSIGYFKAGKVAVNDLFGYVVILSADGDTMVVSARGDGNKSAGGVYVFSNKGNKWLQQATMKVSNIEQLARFGFSMSLSADGNTLAVGALLNNVNAGVINKSITQAEYLSAGVYIFSRKNIAWSQQVYLSVENTTSAFSDLAVSLSADGSTLAVGASSGNINGTNNKVASVHIFNRNAEAWVKQAKIQDVNVKAGHGFAHAVSLSANGNTLAIGAPAQADIANKRSDNSVNHESAVYVFIRDDNRWVRDASVKPENNELDGAFGATVSLSADGNTLAVGNILKNTVTPVRAKPFAAVHVFRRSDNYWIQQAHIDTSQVQGSNGFDVGKLFGGAISLSADGKTLAVGTIDEGSNLTGISSIANRGDNYANASGAVCVFKLSNNIWTQQTHIKASNTEAADLFGLAVSLSADGKTLAVGAVDEDSGTYGIGGDQGDNSVVNSGAVYLY